MFEQFTPMARQAVCEAQAKARALGNDEIAAEHLLLGVMADDEGRCAHLLRNLGVLPEAVAHEVSAAGRSHAKPPDPPRYSREGFLRRRSVQVGGTLPWSAPAQRALHHAREIASSLGQDDLGPAFLVMGVLFDDDEPAARTLRRLGVSPGEVRVHAWAECRRAS